MKGNLTEGGIFQTLIRFAVPYFAACFMQALYGMADLYITGQYNGAAAITAVAVGSQIMHMITVVIIGFAMGMTVLIGNAVGAKDTKGLAKAVGNGIVVFSIFAVLLMTGLLCLTSRIASWMNTPPEAAADTVRYLTVCFAGIPFIVAYNVMSSIFRGMGDSKTPMFFVAVACVVNIVLDILFIGTLGLGAAGAALGTVISQAVSSVTAFGVIRKRTFGFPITRREMIPDRAVIRRMLAVGSPVAVQDGLIQVSFLIITMIANSRGLVAATAVGVVEKIISFLFLVPSALLSAVSAITAQNIGAGKERRANQTLGYGLCVAAGSGLFFIALCQICPGIFVSLFNREPDILTGGCEYLRSYSFDCLFAGVHFCFSGYFCGRGKSYISFVHNIISILLMRIPGAWLASVWFPHTLYPMGWAAPLGSVLSSLICIFFFVRGLDRKSVKKSKDLSI